MNNEKLISAVEDCLRFYDPQELGDGHKEAALIAEVLPSAPSKFTLQQKLYRILSERFDWPFSSYEPIAADLFELKHTFGKTYKVRYSS